MNAFRTVPGHNDVINVLLITLLLILIMMLLNYKADGNDGIKSEVYVCISATGDHDVNIPFRLYAN